MTPGDWVHFGANKEEVFWNCTNRVLHLKSAQGKARQSNERTKDAKDAHHATSANCFTIIPLLSGWSDTADDNLLRVYIPVYIQQMIQQMIIYLGFIFHIKLWHWQSTLQEDRASLAGLQGESWRGKTLWGAHTVSVVVVVVVVVVDFGSWVFTQLFESWRRKTL